MATQSHSQNNSGPAPGSANGSSPSKMKGRSRLITIFFTVFIDLVGFGIVIPLSPFLAREYHASPAEIGFLMAIYSIMQFLFSPVWGSLSDRIGRRPVILVSLLGGAMSYLLFAFSTTLTMLFVARALAGIFGGNISAAHAYIADVTTEKDRSKGMGMIGAAFGLGFIFGPLLGGLLGLVGQKLGSHPPFGMSFSALGAAVLCFANFLLAYAVLEESLPESVRSSPRVRKNRISEILSQLNRPISGTLIAVFFLSGLAMAQMESMLFPYVADVFNWDLKTASYGFAYIGVLMVFTQGYLIRKWMPKLGEPKILAVGLLLFSASLFGLTISSTIPILAISMTILALGNGMMRPPNVGMISLLTPKDEQGAAMGVTNSIASLGRIFGPIVGGILYQNAGRTSPFFLAGMLSVLGLILVMSKYRKLPASGKTSAAEITAETGLNT